MPNPFKRLADNDTPEISGPLRQAQQVKLDPEHIDRLWRDLQARIAQPAPPNGATEGTRTADPNGAPDAGSSDRSGHSKVPASLNHASIVLLAGGLLFVLYSWMLSPAAPLRETVRPPKPPATRTAPVIESLPKPPASTTLTAAPTVAIPALPGAESTPPMAQPNASAPHRRKNASSRKDQVPPRASELELIERAQQHVRAAPRLSLEQLSLHARHYPHGQLTEERELLRIEAARQLGKATFARKAAAAFLRRFPASPHASRVQTIADGTAAARTPTVGGAPAAQQPR